MILALSHSESELLTWLGRPVEGVRLGASGHAPGPLQRRLDERTCWAARYIHRAKL